ncbi:MazG family protein, partial [Raoultibacter timonensis]
MTEHEEFDEFVDTIAALRAPGGCPWDREQTHESIAKNMIEEAYEAVDAIEAGDTVHLREELGDVLLQVVLQSQIAADAGEFTIDDVCRDVNEKMIRRHPHVFGSAKAQSAGDVLELWDSVKLAEKDAVDG